ncbi:MAG: bifunctional demethylmenaquinone methyltransferase/2-methoxy-6-polyprenyl-1,4-benzoquinol methylase UbiE [FCB group bacterium]|nr:bifunctional demethylmenaquinone methyltransferase/2-methoxy-6-polyprenyl-1,4-benzoquinol methylase UbiE [FCB group bacterium]
MTEFIHSGEEKKKYVQKMFDDISPRYDFLNHFLSLGIDLYWRRQLVKSLGIIKGQKILDVATGTGDVGFAILRHHDVQVVGLDYAYNMTVIGRNKAIQRKITSFDFLQGDGENLPFPDSTFDALTISYGFRNIGHYDIALAEFFRGLAPNGTLAILEFSVPRSKLFGLLYRFYFNHVLPKLAGLFSRKSAYRYLPESVQEFPERQEVLEMMKNAGFIQCSFKDLTFGVTSIFSGHIPLES